MRVGGGGRKKVSTLKSFNLSCGLGGGGLPKNSNPGFSHSITPPPPLINDQSLNALLYVLGIMSGFVVIGVENENFKPCGCHLGWNVPN